MAANPQNDNNNNNNNNNQHSSSAFRNINTGFSGHNVIQNAPNQQFAAFVDPTQYAAAQLYGQPSFTPNLINTTAFGAAAAANQNQGLGNFGLGQQFQLIHQQQLAQQLQRQLNQQAQQHHGNGQFSAFQ